MLWSWSFVLFSVGSGLAGFPSAVMVVSVAGFAPCPIAFTDRTLMDIAAIADPERGDISVATQQILAGLRPDRVAVLRFHVVFRFGRTSSCRASRA